jgi:hypothetical protein
MVEKNTPDLMPLADCGLAKQIGRITGLMLVRPFVNDNAKFHAGSTD